MLTASSNKTESNQVEKHHTESHHGYTFKKALEVFSNPYGLLIRVASAGPTGKWGFEVKIVPDPKTVVLSDGIRPIVESAPVYASREFAIGAVTDFLLKTIIHIADEVSKQKLSEDCIDKGLTHRHVWRIKEDLKNNEEVHTHKLRVPQAA